MNDHWTYSAVLIAIMSGVVGIIVGTLVSYRLFRGPKRRQAVYLLLVALLGLSIAQFVEQTRVLVFRLSYDGHIEPGLFNTLYNSSINVSLTKVGLAVSVCLSAAVNLGLYCNRDDETIIRWSVFAVVGTFVMWIILALLINPLM